MDTMAEFARNLLARKSGQRGRVFDWDKAARLIAENRPQEASAGLQDDWEWTGGAIYRDGAAFSDDYTYLASSWAIPEIDMDGVRSECWKYEDEAPDWNADTKWPKSALAILKKAK